MPVAYLVRSQDQLIKVAHPYLERLAAQTEETVGLSIWTDGGIVSVEHIPTIHFFKPAILLGNVSTTYGTTHSKYFLAFGPEERLSKTLFGRPGSRPHTGRGRQSTGGASAGTRVRYRLRP